MEKSSYTFLACADVHLGKNLYNNPTLGEDLKQQFEKAVNKAIELKVDYFIVVGDLFETNKPSADLIDFVRKQTALLRDFNISPIGASGDHDSGEDGVTWMKICDFEPIVSDYLVGINYQIDQQKVAEEVLNRITDSTEFIFLHGQEPSLFPYCDEKKRFLLDWDALLPEYPNVKGIVLGDIHVPLHAVIQNKFIGYCGSLGVTNKSECESKVIYFDGDEIKYLNLPLHRTFKSFTIDENTRYSDILDFIQNEKEKPVVFLSTTRENNKYLKEFLKFKQIAFVIPEIVVEGKDKGISNLIRSSIKLDDSVNSVIEQILTENKVNTKENLELAYKLADAIKTASVKNVLNEFVRTKQQKWIQAHN